jgi:tetratricopeptide (TPR) repeat protein
VWDFARADREFKRALELCPGYATAHQWYALYLAAMRRMDEAVAASGRAEQLDPLSLPILATRGWVLYLARRYEEASETLQKALELDRDFVLAHRRLGQVYEAREMFMEARREYEKCLELAPDDVETLSALGHAYAVSGEPDRAREIINRLVDSAKSRYVPSYLIAVIQIGLNDADAAFKWLERAWAERYGFLAYLNVSPLFDPLRQDERLRELAARVGIE